MIKEITRDDALMWLNSRLNKRVIVALNVDRGGWSISPMELDGNLKHSTLRINPEHGDEIVGVYTVGDDGGIDLTEFPDAAFSLSEGRPGEELRIRVGEHAGIGITSPSFPGV